MNNNSYLCKFIAEHPDWETLFKDKPYNITVKHGLGPYSDLCLFLYNHIKSDFHNPVVQEARGIILDMRTLDVVCWPFRKFTNYSQGYADKIDWSTAKVQEKIDGSIIKLWFFKDLNEWVVSTNSVIDAHFALTGELGEENRKSFYDYFKELDDAIDYDKLDKDTTYMFEICTDKSTVVVRWDKPELYHIGTRNNITGIESVCDIGIKHPKEYDIHDLDTCIKEANTLGPSNLAHSINLDKLKFEGFVVVDDKFNRVKVKTYDYVMAKYCLTKTIKDVEAIYLILNGEDDEFLAYFPNNAEVVNKYKDRVLHILDVLDKVKVKADACFEKHNHERHDFAKEFSQEPYGQYGIAMAIQRKTPAEYLSGLKAKGLMQAINDTIWDET